MPTSKILPGVEFKNGSCFTSEASVIAMVKAIKAKGDAAGHKKNHIHTHDQEHSEIRAYRNRVSKKGRLVAQAYLKNIQAQAIDLKELFSSQPGVRKRGVNYFVQNPDEINKPQLTRRYGTPENGYHEYAIVGITSDGKKFVIDGNHRISAAKKLGKDSIQAKVISLPDFQAFGTHEGAVLGWEHRMRALHPDALHVKKIFGLPYASMPKRAGKERRYHLYDKNFNKIGTFIGDNEKKQMKEIAKHGGVKVAHDQPQDTRNQRMAENLAKLQEAINNFGKEKQPAVASPAVQNATEIEKKLSTSEVVSKKGLGGGINETQIVTLQDGSKAVFKPKEGEYAGMVRQGILDQQMERELAAWRVAKTVGMDDLCCPTVQRIIDGKVGALIQFKQGDLARQLWGNRKDPYDGRIDRNRAAVFDYVIGNTDRHMGNWLVEQGRVGDRLHLIDHGLSFSESRTVGGNRMFQDKMARHPESELPADAVKAYVDKKDDILRELKFAGIPPKAIELVSERITKIGSAKKWGDISW